MESALQKKIEALAEEFNNDVWGGEEDRCFIMSYKRGATTMGEWAERLEVALGDAVDSWGDYAPRGEAKRVLKVAKKLLQEWSQFLRDGVDDA